MKNYLEYANEVVKQYPINEYGNATFLYAQGLYFNTTNYWENIYWWAPGFNDATKTRLEVPIYTDLLTLTATEGLIAGVTSNAQGKREVYIYRNNVWDRIGLEDGTIQFLSGLWDYEENNIGFGDNFYDSTMYDVYPSVETRYIIRALNEQIYVGALLPHRNKSLTLMFEYIQSEATESNNYLPWINKTSLADVVYNVRQLEQTQKYQRDNQSMISGFINENKPLEIKVTSSPMPIMNNLKWMGGKYSKRTSDYILIMWNYTPTNHTLYGIEPESIKYNIIKTFIQENEWSTVDNNKDNYYATIFDTDKLLNRPHEVYEVIRGQYNGYEFILE